MSVAKLRGGFQHACPGLRTVHCAKVLGRTGLRSSLDAAGARLCAWRRAAFAQKDAKWLLTQVPSAIEACPPGVSLPRGDTYFEAHTKEWQ